MCKKNSLLKDKLTKPNTFWNRKTVDNKSHYLIITVSKRVGYLSLFKSVDLPSTLSSGAGFNGRVNGFTRVDSARPVAGAGFNGRANNLIFVL